jgi:hypothetical protein
VTAVVEMVGETVMLVKVGMVVLLELVEGMVRVGFQGVM